MTDLTTNGDQYEPPANDSIIQGAGSAPGGQFATSTTSTTGHNEPWRYNNGTNMATHTRTPRHIRPDHLVIMASTTTHRTLQTIEMGPHALNVENKVT